MRSASFSVARSPSITAIFSRPPSARIVASSSAVLPAPGDDIRFIASTPWPSKCSRLCAATRSFSPRIAVITSMVSILPATPSGAASGARVAEGPSEHPQSRHIAVLLWTAEEFEVSSSTRFRIISSPPITSTCQSPQAPQTSRFAAASVSASQVRQRTRTGTVSITSEACSAIVPAAASG